jgi:hypothetical protein
MHEKQITKTNTKTILKDQIRKKNKIKGQSVKNLKD